MVVQQPPVPRNSSERSRPFIPVHTSPGARCTYGFSKTRQPGCRRAGVNPDGWSMQRPVPAIGMSIIFGYLILIFAFSATSLYLDSASFTNSVKALASRYVGTYPILANIFLTSLC